MLSELLPPRSAVMKAMGHRDIKTTMIYVEVAKLHIQEVADPYRIPLPHYR